VEIRYNRQLNEGVYYFRFFTAWDFVVMMCLLGGTQVAFATFLSTVVALFAFIVYTVTLRFSRPAGFDVHLFKSWFMPKQLKAGRAQPRSLLIGKKP